MFVVQLVRLQTIITNNYAKNKHRANNRKLILIQSSLAKPRRYAKPFSIANVPPKSIMPPEIKHLLHQVAMEIPQSSRKKRQFGMVNAHV